MFVRKKRNKSGSVSVQVIQKDNGYKVVKTIGASSDAVEIERLEIQGRQFIKSLQPPQPYLLPVVSRNDQVVEVIPSCIIETYSEAHLSG